MHLTGVWFSSQGSRCLVASDMLGGDWEQGQMPGTLDGNGQPALVLGASACFPSILDLAALGQVAAQGGQVLVVYRLGFFQTESAHFAPPARTSPVRRAPATASPVFIPIPIYTGAWSPVFSLI